MRHCSFATSQQRQHDQAERACRHFLRHACGVRAALCCPTGRQMDAAGRCPITRSQALSCRPVAAGHASWWLWHRAVRRDARRLLGSASAQFPPAGGRLLLLQRKLLCRRPPPRSFRLAGRHLRFRRARLLQEQHAWCRCCIVMLGCSGARPDGVQVNDADAPTVQLSAQSGGRCEGTGVHWSRTDPAQLAACFETGQIHMWNAGRGAPRSHEVDVADATDYPVLWQEATTKPRCFSVQRPTIVSCAPLQSTPVSVRRSLLLREPGVATPAQSPALSPQSQRQAREEEHADAQAATPVLQRAPAGGDLETGWRMTLSPQRRPARAQRGEADMSQAVSLASEMPSQHGLLPHAQDADLASARTASQPVRCAATGCTVLHARRVCYAARPCRWCNGVRHVYGRSALKLDPHCAECCATHWRRKR